MHADPIDICVEKNPTNMRIAPFSRHIGRGVDAIVMPMRDALAASLDSRLIESSTVIALHSRLVYFFEYCAREASKRNRHLAWNDLDAAFAAEWASHCQSLQNMRGTAYSHSVRRQIHETPRIVISKMADLGLGREARLSFKRGLFPNANSKHSKRNNVYSASEFDRILKALKREISLSRTKEFFNSYDLSIRVLLVAIRTGMNVTPLLELKRDCLQPHPIDPKRRVLRSFKRRAHRETSISLPIPNVRATAEAPPDAVSVIGQVLERTLSLSTAAPSSIIDRLWLYASRGSDKDRITHLTPTALASHLNSFSERTELRTDSGSPLKLSLSAVRVTFVNRVYEASSGNLTLTAAIANNSPRVSDLHYLEAPPDGEGKFALAGTIVLSLLKGEADPVKYIRTAVAGCQDPLYGERAPKDGHTYCEKFLNCFSCKHMMVAGDDLHRLFSFYWLLMDKLAATRSTPLHAQIKATIRTIDNEISVKFPKSTVLAAKAKARRTPHPMWDRALDTSHI